jgi:hypothetical protein
MEIKGSGSKYYEVNLEELTCSCRDWICRRHNFSKMDDRRLCKHLLEAIELSSVYNSFNIPTLNSPRIVGVNNLDLLNDLLLNSNLVIKYVIGKKLISNSYTNKYIPVIIEYVNYINAGLNVFENSNPNCRYRFIRNAELGELYDGDIPLIVIPATADNFLFKSLYFSLSYDEYMKLSSISFKRLNLKLSMDGFIDKNGKIVDMKIYTKEELYRLLGIEEI